MANRWWESFDNMGTGSAAILTKYDDSRSNNNMDLTTTHPRTGTASLRTIGAGLLTTKPLNVSGPTFAVGFSYFMDASSFGAGASGNGYFCDITEEDGTIHCRLAITTTGLLKVYRGTTLLATASGGALTFNTHYQIGFKGVIDDTTGSFDVKVDNVSVSGLTATGQDTRNGGTGTWNRLAIRHAHVAGNDYIDDLYINDGSGAINNDLLGFLKIGSSLAVADSVASGFQHDFTTSTGTDHGALVDESSPNGDTDYNFSSTPGQIDLYRIQPVSLLGTTRGIQINLYMKKTDAGVRTTRAVVRSAGTNYPQVTQSPLTTYGYMSTPVETDPATGTFWSAAAINAGHYGPEIVT